jgi:hypothetical protein
MAHLTSVQSLRYLMQSYLEMGDWVCNFAGKHAMRQWSRYGRALIGLGRSLSSLFGLFKPYFMTFHEIARYVPRYMRI